MASPFFLDFDLFEPIRVAHSRSPSVPIGGIVAFDELDNAAWPGEMRAALEGVEMGNLELRRLAFGPYVAFTVRR